MKKDLNLSKKQQQRHLQIITILMGQKVIYKTLLFYERSINNPSKMALKN